MIDERTRTAHAIFVAALEYPEPKRGAYVSQACGADNGLRREVERLLDAVEQSAEFLESPAIGVGTRAADKPALTPVLDVPGYRVIRTLGVGGMARVYEAEQEHPKRLVALKVMQHSPAETSALQRFDFEAQILARLKHPGIAQIHEVGTLEDEAGRTVPFFAMELVDDAQPITRFAASAALGFRERLELFVEVCDAVRCGHQAGVIHRDLKPTNVLVDGSGRVKVIDFGIARSLGTLQAHITLDSERGSLIGTLNYMSPEQCAGGPVDTRADVYALGVMLYELVSGRLPHELSRASIPEALRIIEKLDPPRPSSVTREASGDIELILLTAIDKDPERRYFSAAELAEDVRRFLAHQPIRARPPTALYQARKFAQRHRTLVTAAGVVGLILVAGVLVTSRMAYVTEQARQAAERRGQELERVTEFQSSQLSDIDVPAMGELLRDTLLQKLDPNVVSRAEAEALFEDVNFTSVALALLDQGLLDRSRIAIDERFDDQPLLRARLQQTLAGTMNTLGLPDRAEPVLEDALATRHTQLGADHPDTLVSAHAMGALLLSLGKYEQSHEHLRSTYDRRARELGADHPDTLQTANTLGGLLRMMGRIDEAAETWQATLDARRRVLGDDHRDTLISLNNVGVIHAVRGDFASAETAWRELVERRLRVFGEDHPAYRNSLSNLGALLLEQGKLTEARVLLERSLESLLRALGEEHPSTLTTMTSLANVLIELQDPEAGTVLQHCLDMRTKVLGPQHPATLRSRVQLAAFVAGEGQAAEAVETLREVLAIQRRELGSDHPDAIETMYHLANGLLELGRPAEARIIAAECVERAGTLTPGPNAPNSAALLVLAAALQKLGQFASAESALLEARAGLAASLGQDNPRTLEASEALADLYAAWKQTRPETYEGPTAEGTDR